METWKRKDVILKRKGENTEYVLKHTNKNILALQNLLNQFFLNQTEKRYFELTGHKILFTKYPENMGLNI